MATKVGTMKEKSKSESIQTRPRLKRTLKYKSMTLRRQEAKLDVTINDADVENQIPNHSLDVCNVTIDSLCSANLDESSILNKSLLNKIVCQHSANKKTAEFNKCL
jgi:hypothetical protein